jgi:hypothetical protein
LFSTTHVGFLLGNVNYGLIFGLILGLLVGICIIVIFEGLIATLLNMDNKIEIIKEKTIKRKTDDNSKLNYGIDLSMRDSDVLTKRSILLRNIITSIIGIIIIYLIKEIFRPALITGRYNYLLITMYYTICLTTITIIGIAFDPITAFFSGFIGVLLSYYHPLPPRIPVPHIQRFDISLMTSYLIVALLLGLYGVIIGISHNKFAIKKTPMSIKSIIKSTVCQLISLLLFIIVFYLIQLLNGRILFASEFGTIVRMAVFGGNGVFFKNIGKIQSICISIFIPLVIGILFFILYQLYVHKNKMKCTSCVENMES